MREPLLHFLLIGLLLYGVAAFVKSRTDASHKIVIDDAIVSKLVNRFALQTGAAPDKEQLESLINTEIREEIQYREAIRLGLDKDDEIIRRRLSQKVEFLKSDLEVIPEPTDEELQRFYQQHQALFRDSTTISFTHIYLNGDKQSPEQIKERAEGLLLVLKEKKLTRAPELGDRFPLQYDYSDMDPLEANQQFGSSPMTDTLFKIPVQQWIGPVKSGYGWHLIYVQQRKPGSVRPFSEIRDIVHENYISFARQEQNQKSWEKMKDKYVIDLDYLKGKNQ